MEIVRDETGKDLLTLQEILKSDVSDLEGARGLHLILPREMGRAGEARIRAWGEKEDKGIGGPPERNAGGVH